jgi:hypothetical protein
MERTEIFVTGYAKLPQGITAAELYSIIAVGMMVDRNTGVIADVDCTLATEMGKNFVKSLVVGKNLNEVEAIDAEFNENYFGSAKKALISAIRTCNEKFRQIQNNPNKELA